MKISVAVCTYNRSEILKKSLYSLINQSFASEDYEIIVIDNNSSDDTKNVCSDFISKNKTFNIRYFFEPKQGLSYARNMALKKSKGEIILYTDDDCIADKNLLKEHFKVYSDDMVACAGGKILVEFMEKKPKWLCEKFYKYYGYLDISDKITDLDSSPYGGNISFKKNVLIEKNLSFDINLGRKAENLNGGEEVFVVESIKSYGYKIKYNPNALVTHLICGYKMQKKYLRKIVKDGAAGFYLELKVLEKKRNLDIIFLSIYNIIIYGLSYFKNLFLLRFDSVFYAELYLIKYFKSFFFVFLNIFKNEK